MSYAEDTKSFTVPEADRERLGFAAPWHIEVLDLPAGPRSLPAWCRGAHIDWHWPYSNSPSYKVRCRTDPLAFSTDGSPAWRMFSYHYNGKNERGFIAEQDGVAAVHYHSGAISLTDFEDTVLNERGEIVWVEKPDWRANKPGVPLINKHTMLATTQQDGYAGRHFTITLMEQEIPVYSKGTGVVMTKVEAGTKLRLRGPWHGGAPEGYSESSYWIDEDGARWGTWANKRKWYARGGYFGLYVKRELLLDILTTYEPHVPWAQTTETVGKNRQYLRPLIPETGLPKGWLVYPDQCPGHDFILSPYATGPVRESPSDTCRMCGQKRDPNWVYRSSITGKVVEYPNRKEPIYFDRFLEPPKPKVSMPPRWPADVAVPLRKIGGPNG